MKFIISYNKKLSFLTKCGLFAVESGFPHFPPRRETEALRVAVCLFKALKMREIG